MVMLLVSDDRSFKEHKNRDDVLGNRVTIPTVILKKDEGDEIKRFIDNNMSEHVVMSIKFSGVKNGEMLTIDLFMKSDNVKSLHFFKEFEQYYKKLSKNSFFFQNKLISYF
jgi:hypothetical protein